MSAKRPNFLIILADDLGFSDIGCFGSEIQTPHIDALSKDGLRLLNFHTAAACSPTRAMIMSGTDAHLGGLGVMIEYKQHERGQKRWAGKQGYDGYLNKDVATIPEILSDNGYFTAAAGKWHLGLRPDHGPAARGFQKCFNVLPGCCNHFGWEPVLENGFAGMPAGGRPLHAENGKRFIVEPNKTENPNGFYSSNYYTTKLMQYLDERTEEEKEKPFFSYLAFSAPHWPLQSPRSARDKYKDMYNDGPGALRQKRLAKLVEMGLVDKDVVPHDVVAPEVPEWDSFTDHEKLCSSRAMAAYAGMVDQIDVNVGRVVQYLKDKGEYDNTFIIFMSDNGAEGAAMEAVPVLGTKIQEAIHAFYDNSPDNLGSWNSYCWLGPLWAQASTAPSRLYKTYPSEGGILVPGVVKPPKGTFQSQYTQGKLNRSFTTCMDLAPTFLEYAGISLPKAPTPRKVQFRGREVYDMRGRSWLPYFSKGVHSESGENENWAVYPSTQAVGWELFARAALRKGDWKIVHLPKEKGGVAEGDEGWELHNLAQDPGETKDLAGKNPEKLAELLKHWDEYVVECGVVWGNEEAFKSGVSKDEAPELWDSQMEQQRTWMHTPVGSHPKLGEPPFPVKAQA